MTGKRVLVSMPESLVQALNRYTARSPKSRSEIVCDALQRYLVELREIGPAEAVPASDEGLSAEVTRMMESGLLKPEDFSDPRSERGRPKGKLWIN